MRAGAGLRSTGAMTLQLCQCQISYLRLHAVSLYLGKPGEGAARVYEKVNDRWEVCVSVSEGQVRARPGKRDHFKSRPRGRRDGWRVPCAFVI